MELNQQAPEKRVQGPGTVLAVNSIFLTIQGEGPFAGTPSVFVRLAGCNLQCPMCDTEYTNRTAMTVEEILDRVEEVHTPNVRLVVITGGEPFRQPIAKFVTTLVKAGYNVQIETNGSLYPGEDGFPWHFCAGYPRDRGQRVWIVCSPKLNVVHRRLVPFIDAFKYVATAESLMADGLPRHALDNPSAGALFRPPVDPAQWQGEVYLQPVDEKDPVKNKINEQAVVQSCIKHGYRLCLQVHKIIEVE